MKYDTIIIGKGPAGISAAIYLKRYNLNPLVIGYGLGALETPTKIENYYGFDSIDGKELISKGIQQAKKLDIEVVDDEVLGIAFEDDYCVTTKNAKYNGKTIFLATGKNRVKLKALNVKQFEGKGISYCATCDGFFYRKKRIAVVGSKDYMLQELKALENFTKDITVFTDGMPLEVDVDYPVVLDKIISFNGDDTLKEISVKGKAYPADAAFIAVGSAQALDFCKHLGIIVDELNYIKVDENFMTNIPGVFAGGDVIGGLLQISKAVSDGANAAGKIKQYITKKSI